MKSDRYYSARMRADVTCGISRRYNELSNYFLRVGLNLHEGGDTRLPWTERLTSMVSQEAFILQGVAIGVTAVKPFPGEKGSLRLDLMSTREKNLHQVVERINRRFPGLETYLGRTPYEGRSP